MLLRPDDMRYLHVLIIDDTCQVIHAGPVGALDEVVLLVGPLDAHRSSYVVIKLTRPLARHLQPHRCLSSLGLELGTLPRSLGHPPTTVDLGSFLFLGSRSLRVSLL